MPDGDQILVNSDLHRKLHFLLEPHPYKVVYSGRFGMKTRSAIIALLNLAGNNKLRILCCREVMDSIKESLHHELTSQISDLGLGGFFHPFETEIRGDNGSEFIFAGLHGHSAESIKSYADVDIVLVDEAQKVIKRSWDILIPTIRKPGSQIWVLFNPEGEKDDTWQRWVVHPLPGTVVRKTSWRDAQEVGWFPEQENQKRLHFQRTQPDDYDNIWEGVPRSTAEGAIYRREMTEMLNEGRLRAVPYDPRFQVHTIWDLGWADSIAVTMVQKPVPTVVNVINYLEDNNRKYSEIVGELDRLRYRWGTDWLPHDGVNKNPQTGMSAQMVLRQLGRRNVRIIGRGDPVDGIRQARMLLPRCYIDNSTRKTFGGTGYLGGGRLIECMQNYRWRIPKTTDEPAEPLHDQYSHGADTMRGLAAIVDQIRDDSGRQMIPSVAAFRPSDATLGNLG